jgi:hypothetical protein
MKKETDARSRTPVGEFLLLDARQDYEIASRIPCNLSRPSSDTPAF